MQLYIAIDGERRGPFSLYSVTEMLREGKVEPDALGWHRGRESWTSLEKIPALDGTIKAIRRSQSITEPDDLPSVPREKAVPAPAVAAEGLPSVAREGQPRKAVLNREVRPFIRFWARQFDYLLVFLVLGVIDSSLLESMVRPRVTLEMADVIRATTITLGALATWHAVEAILLHTIGTTPGKALFSIRVRRSDGGRPKLTEALARSFCVWVVGYGLGLLLLGLAAMGLSFFRLLSTGTTLWDKQLRLYVQHAPIGPARIALAAAAFALLMALFFQVLA